MYWQLQPRLLGLISVTVMSSVLIAHAHGGGARQCSGAGRVVRNADGKVTSNKAAKPPQVCVYACL